MPRYASFSIVHASSSAPNPYLRRRVPRPAGSLRRVSPQRRASMFSPDVHVQPKTVVTALYSFASTPAFGDGRRVCAVLPFKPALHSFLGESRKSARSSSCLCLFFFAFTLDHRLTAQPSATRSSTSSSSRQSAQPPPRSQLVVHDSRTSHLSHLHHRVDSEPPAQALA